MRSAPPVRLVIFDCDGVLVDSERIALRVDLEAFAELGWVMAPDELVARFMGRSEAWFLAELTAWLGHPPPADWLARLRDRYRAALATELTEVDGVSATLDALDRMGLATCVASSGDHDKLRFTLGKTGLYPRFAGRVFSATEVAHGKPAPDLFLHAARALGVPPTACVVVEDALPGLAAARAAGMRAFAYAGGGMVPRDQLAGPGTVVIDDLRALPGLLAGASAG